MRSGIDNAPLGDLTPHALNELLRHVPTDIGLDEQHFEIFVELVVDRLAIEQPTDLAEDALARLCQSLL